jgi:hypothetical protein
MVAFVSTVEVPEIDSVRHPITLLKATFGTKVRNFHVASLQQALRIVCGTIFIFCSCI